MTATYEKIATTTLGSSSTSVTLSSIPATYTDLVCIISGTVATASSVGVRFNGDTGSNYSRVRLLGDGTTASSSANGSITNAASGGLGTVQSVSILNINNYANTTTYKTILARGSVANSFVAANAALWRNTSAINSINFMDATYQTGTVFTLYGIKAE